MSIRSRVVAIALVGVSLAPAFTAHGDESLADKQYWDAEMVQIKQTLDQTNIACGTSIPFEWVNKTDLRDKATKAGTHPSGVCSPIMTTVTMTCNSSADAKSRVAKKIKGISCGYGDPRAITLSGGKLTLMGNIREYNFDQWATPTVAGLL